MSSNKNSQELDRLCDSLVEDILSATDEDILNEAAEDYIDPDSAVAFVRSTIGKARLLNARKCLSNINRTGDSAVPRSSTAVSVLDDNSVLQIFRRVSEQRNDISFSMAARNGKELTVQDMRSLLADLQDLGIDLNIIIDGIKNE